MAMPPAGPGGGWVPKSSSGKNVLKWTVWCAAPVVATFIIFIAVTHH